MDFSSEPFPADLWRQARIKCWVGVASLWEKGGLVMPKLPFQAPPLFSFPSAQKDCSTWLCSAGVCFCEPAKIHVRCCRKPWLMISACSVVANLPSGASCDPGRCVFVVEFHQNGIIMLFLLQEVAFADVFHLPKTLFFVCQIQCSPGGHAKLLKLSCRDFRACESKGTPG